MRSVLPNEIAITRKLCTPLHDSPLWLAETPPRLSVRGLLEVRRAESTLVSGTVTTQGSFTRELCTYLHDSPLWLLWLLRRPVQAASSRQLQLGSHFLAQNHSIGYKMLPVCSIDSP